MRRTFVLCLFSLVTSAMAEEPSPVAEALAGTLLSSVGFMMLLFYLMNWPDVEIRMYTNKTISLTIAIFIAVMIYNYAKECLANLTRAESPAALIAMCVFHRLFWHICLELTLLIVCRKKEGAQSEKAIKRTKVSATCWGTLMAHIGGFASIGIWTELQRLPCFGTNPITQQFNPAVGIHVFPIAVLFEYLLWKAAGALRGAVRGNHHDDHAEHDPESEQHEHCDVMEEIWEEALVEAKWDACALIYSFVLVLSVRFWIKGGVMDSLEEIESNVLQTTHKASMAAEMFGFGILCLIAMTAPEHVFEFFRTRIDLSGEYSYGNGLDKTKRTLKQDGTSGSCPETGCTFSVSGREVVAFIAERDEAITGEISGSAGSYSIHWSNGLIYHQATCPDGIVPDWLVMIRLVLGMCVGWSFLFASQWMISHLVPTENATLLAAIVAAGLSFTGFSSIYILDKCADAVGPWSAELEAWLYIMVDTIPLGVGFSWERTFDNSIDVLAEASGLPVIVKLPLTLAIVALIIPSWRLYILPTIVHRHWHFGFDPHSAIENCDFDSKESVQRYVELIKHVATLGEHELDPNATPGVVRAPSQIPDLEHIHQKADAATQIKVYRMVLDALANTAKAVEEKLDRASAFADLSKPLMEDDHESKLWIGM